MDDPANPPPFFVTYHGERNDPKRHQSVQATRLIHEHYGTIMAYAYSRAPLTRLVNEKFRGEWDGLHKALFEIPEQRVERALIELGLYIRLVDDGEDRLISQMRKGNSYGEIVRPDGAHDPLPYREVSNKIIHAVRYTWSLADIANPTVTCIAGKEDNPRDPWTSATISLIGLGAMCGEFMS